MNKSILCFLVIAVLSVGVSAESRADSAELENLIATALQQNPRIQAQEARAVAARQRVPQASAFEDPRLGVRASNLPLSDLGLDATPMSGIDLSLAQKIPFPGKRKFRKAAEQASSSATSAGYEEMRNRIRFEVSRAYYDLYRIDKGITVTRENRRLVNALAQTAETRYTTGAAHGPDVFRAQTLAAELENKLLELAQERESAVLHLNTLLNRPVQTPVKLRYRFRIKKPPSQQGWQDAAKERPLVQAMSHQIDAEDQRVRLAQRDYWPDLDFSVSYRLRESAPGDPVNGSDFISGGLTINLPLWAHWSEARKVDETRARKRAAEQTYQAIHNETTFEAMDAHRTLVRQYRQIGLFDSRLLPQSRATYETSIVGYQSDQIDFFSTIEALKEKHQTELTYYEIKAAYQSSQARLAWILGAASQQSTATEVSS